MPLSEDILTRVYKVISEAFSNEVNVDYELPKFKSYPFEKARPGHNEDISRILSSDFSFVTSPTGYGKTAVYLTAAVESGLKTMIITPRNKLQEDVSKYNLSKPILYLFDRFKMCKYHEVPCRKKFKINGKFYFKYKDDIVKYPCADCPYEIKKQAIFKLFKENECIVVMNQGNFWAFRNEAEFVIVDEADETVKSITNAVSYPKPFKSDDPVEVLSWMYENVVRDINKINEALEHVRNDVELDRLNSLLRKLENKLRKIEFFSGYKDDLITYIRGNSTYVELFDDIINIVKRLFKCKVCLVTATPPPDRSFKSRSYPFRAKVIYCPVGNMSERNVFRHNNENLIEDAVHFIINTYDYIVKLTGMKKAPIHCGNLSKHGIKIYELLKANGKKAVLMEKGKQYSSIKQFIESDSDFLCAVSIEYGFDWGFSPVQYILKVPFSDLGDPRISAVRKVMGSKFNDWYSWDALSRLIQACGRNARGPNDFGVTIILDSCFGRLYERYKDRVPQWFKDRLVLIGWENV